jgi:hypothetical protein
MADTAASQWNRRLDVMMVFPFRVGGYRLDSCRSRNYSTGPSTFDFSWTRAST